MLKKIILSIVVLIFTASYSYAGNVQTFGIGSKATSMAEAVSAYSDDPFAVYYNPAGLVINKRSVLSVGLMTHFPDVELSNFKATGAISGVDRNATDGMSDSASLKDSDAIQFHMGYSMPITEKLFFGIAAYSPYGMHIKWDKDPMKNPGAAYAWESYYGRMVVNPSVAYKVNDKLSFGFGVSLGKSVSEAGKTIFFTGATVANANGIVAAETASPGSTGLSPEQIAGAGQIVAMDTNGFNGAKLKLEASDDLNYSFNFGVMYQPIEKISLGLTYRGRTETDFDGDSYLTMANGTKLMGAVDMEYDHPESVQAGVRYFATKNLSLEFDMTWTRWSINEEQIEYIKIPGSTVFENYPAAHDRDWEDTIQYKIGAEWAVVENVALRGGYTYDPTPVPDDTFDIGWPDTDRSVFNIGCGWKITENWEIDSVVQYIISTPTNEIRDGESTELNHNYSGVYGEPVAVEVDSKGELWGMGVTVSYLF